MKEASQVTALVFDHGLFVPIAQRLAVTYKRVLYHSPFEEGFTTLNKSIIGDGFPEIERCEDFWSIKDEIDLFVFPDIQHAGLQLELERQGKAVWGSRGGDSLELKRQKFHRVLEEVGLDVPSFTVVKGLDALREHLRDKTDKYLKISKYRGSMETTHWRDWDLDEGWLDVMAVRFGPAKNLIPFLVFDEIETELEIGGDTYCVDGNWPGIMLHGDEWKDKGYFGAVTKREDMPEQIQKVMEAFSPILKEERYRNQWSMELRVTKEAAYFIDPTCRGGLPSTGSQLALWGNFPDIVWAGANGELLDPEPTSKFAAECVLTMKGEKHQWGKTRVVEELQDWAKFGGCCQIDGAVCFPPDDSHGEEIGWLVAIGDTMAETIEDMLARVKKLPDGVSANTESLIHLLKEIREAEKQGIEFTPQRVPEPATVLEDA